MTAGFVNGSAATAVRARAGPAAWGPLCSARGRRSAATDVWSRRASRSLAVPGQTGQEAAHRLERGPGRPGRPRGQAGGVRVWVMFRTNQERLWPDLSSGWAGLREATGGPGHGYDESCVGGAPAGAGCIRSISAAAGQMEAAGTWPFESFSILRATSREAGRIPLSIMQIEPFDRRPMALARSACVIPLDFLKAARLIAAECSHDVH